MYLNISRILWAFNISKKQIDGIEVEAADRLVPGWMCIPQPFECDITVRSPERAKLIEGIWDEAKRKLAPDER